jgi:hypothetical protein
MLAGIVITLLAIFTPTFTMTNNAPVDKAKQEQQPMAGENGVRIIIDLCSESRAKSTGETIPQRCESGFSVSELAKFVCKNIVVHNLDSSRWPLGNKRQYRYWH